MKKLKIISFILAVLFVIGSLQAEDLISFNGRYTNVVFSAKNNLWKEKDKFTFEEIQNECKKRSGNADVWYIAGYYWQHRIKNRKKAGECYKKSMELAPTAFIPHSSFIDILRRNNSAEELFCQLTNLFYKIKNLNNALNWSWRLNYFRNEDTNQLERLYYFIQKNKNKMPAYKYALGKCACQAGKYEVAFENFAQELEETNSRIEKRNILNELESSHEYADNPKLMAKRNLILKKYLSPFRFAVKKIEDLRSKHNNPKLYILTSNAFALAKNQRERILAIHDLANYCYNTKQEEIKNFIDEIVAEKNVNPIFADMLIRNMNTINATNNLHSYCARVIDKMPENLNSINNLIRSVHSNNNGRNKPEADKYVLNLIVEKFPDNYSVINSVAEKYKEYGCYKEELNCRKKMLPLTNNKDFVSKTKARITELKLKLGLQVDNKNILADNLNDAERNASAAIVISKFYLKTGKTNDALNILMKCAENKDFPGEANSAADAILNIEWGNYNEEAMDTFFELISNNYSVLDSFAGKVMWKYFNTGFEEKAIDTFAFITKNNDRPYKFEKIIKLLNADKLVDKIISDKITNDYVLLRTSYILNNDNNKPEAYKLRNYFINLPDENRHKYSEATQMLEYAFRDGNTNLCFEIVDKIDGFVKQKIIPRGLPENLYYYMLNLNLTNKCDSWVEFMLRNTDDKRLTENLYTYSKWYMRAGFTNKLKTLVAKNCAANLSIYELFKLLSVFDYTKDTNRYELYVETIGDSLTNALLVNRYGCNYLGRLDYLSRFSGKNYDEQINRFLQEWFYNNEININTKFSMLHYAKSNQVDYINYLAKDKNKFNSGRLMNIARLFINYGITNKGIEFYSYALDNPQTKDNNKINIIISIVRMYIRNQKYHLAENELDKISQLNSNKKNVRFFTNIGDLYARAFKYLKAVDCYIKTINNADDISSVKLAASRISNLWRYDSEIEYSKLAEINFTNKNAAFNYTAKALFLLLANNTYEAEKYILKAEEKLKTNKEKYDLWNTWCNFMKDNNSPQLRLDGYLKMYDLTSNVDQKCSVVRDMNYILRKMKDYETMLKINDDLLNVVTNDRRRDEVIYNISDAYMKLGDTNSAWEAVLQISNLRDLKNIAYRIQKNDELIKEFELRINTANTDDFVIIAYTLARDYYPKNMAALNKLALSINEKIDEINPKNYLDLSHILLEAGNKEMAKRTLEKYIDHLDEKDKTKAEKLLNKYLDLNWWNERRPRGYIPEEENLWRLWPNERIFRRY